MEAELHYHQYLKFDMTCHKYLRSNALLVIFLISVLASCKQGLNIQSKRDVAQADSVYRMETQRFLNVLITKYFQSEYFSLSAKSSPYRYEWNRMQDSLQHIDSAFCNKVLKTLEYQLNNTNPYIWTEEMLPKAIIVDFTLRKTNPIFFKKIKAMAGQGIYFLSAPLFNDRYDLALVDYGFSCGDRCGRGKLILYRKVNGQWEEYKILSNWIT